MHITMPYSMIEPIREQLDAGVQSDTSEQNDRWALSLQEEMKGAAVGVSSSLVEAELTLNQILNLKTGDIIPIDLPEYVTVMVEDIPVFRGQYGVSRGNSAIKILSKLNLFCFKETSYYLVGISIEARRVET